MSEYAEGFAKNKIEFPFFPNLTDQHRRDLGIVPARPPTG